MKKLLTLVLVASMALFYACGPSAEEKAAAEKATQDSIAAVEKAAMEAQEAAAKVTQDSIAAIEQAAREKAMMDSVAAATTKKVTTKVKQAAKPKEEAPKVEEKKSKFNKSGANK